MKKRELIIYFFLAILSMGVLAEEHGTQSVKTMAISVEGNGSLPPGYGGGLRFEYALSRVFSIIAPIEYRNIAMSLFAESSKFTIITGGFGGKLYFSQFFWPQAFLQGFFVEGKMGVGYAHETGGHPQERNNLGWTFSLSTALGYSHAFDCGLVLGGSFGISARGYTPPISVPLISYPMPELSLSLGWAF
jgi:hypothetical protein